MCHQNHIFRGSVTDDIVWYWVSNFLLSTHGYKFTRYLKATDHYHYTTVRQCLLELRTPLPPQSESSSCDWLFIYLVSSSLSYSVVRQAGESFLLSTLHHLYNISISHLLCPFHTNKEIKDIWWPWLHSKRLWKILYYKFKTHTWTWAIISNEKDWGRLEEEPKLKEGTIKEVFTQF